MSSDTKHEDGAFALDPDDVPLNDIIDITAMDLNDQERWLLQCNQTYSKADVNDIRTWLHSSFLDNDMSTDCVNNENRKLIDTRTWTRPKKRFSRLSFEAIKEQTSPPQLQSVKHDIWRSGSFELLNNHTVNQESDENSDEIIPPMLRLSLTGSSNIGHTTTGQESLEAFLNMSQSNGIDSFINMEAPEFNETLFTNLTRPSIMSISSSSLIHIQDDNNHSINQSIGLADSQILTESMMHTSIFNDVSEVNFNDAFAKDNVNVSVIENPHYCIDKSDGTIVCNNDTFNSSTIKLNENETVKKIDMTFTSNELSDALNSKSYIVNNTFDADSPESNHLSYIVIKETRLPDNKLIDSLDIVDEEELAIKLNATFDAGSSSSQESINSTLTLSPRHTEKSIKLSIDSVEPLESLNATYSANENDSPSPIEMKYKINKTYQTLPNSSKTINTTFKAPLSINNQQLSSVNSTFVAEAMLNETYDENVPSMPPLLNHYQTYRRNPMEMKKKNSQQLTDTTNDQTFIAPNPPTMENRYQTYRKHSLAISRIKSTNIISTNDCPSVVDGQAKSLENLAGIKVNVENSRKLYAPKNFSRLPQSLRKSNPNLTTSNALKMTVIPTRISNFGFNRQRQINRGDPSLTSKLYSVAKFSKCGSEQMLNGPTENSEYLETVGSTESIESTQSAHSAPDLDDRLSICSDSGNNLYYQRTMNIDELHKIVQRQEESLERESMIDRKILENTWVSDETNLPSPIMKESETLGSRGSSPGSIDSTVKTSSPLLSPAESLQSLNANSGHELIDHKPTVKPIETEQQKKLMMPSKPSRISELKSGIRQPINRSVNAMSGIPRPASRIPAPRFTRANVKSHVETKKNIL